MSTLNFECPGCSQTQSIALKGWFTKTLAKSCFCGNCGLEIHAKCPECAYQFRSVSTFCENCGSRVYSSNNSIDTENSAGALNSTQRRQLHQLENDIADYELFQREMILVMFRLYGVNAACHQFNEILDQIDDETENAERAHVVGVAIEAVDLGSVQDNIDELAGVLHDLLSGMFGDAFKASQEALPDWERWVGSIPDVEAMMQEHQQAFVTALHANDAGIDLIGSRYRQLKEYLPRYNEIMNRSGFLDFLIGFGAGWMGGEIGVVAAEIWDDWRGESDEDFVKLFGAAIDDFIETCGAYLEATEAELERSCDALERDLSGLMRMEIDGIERAARANVDIDPVYKKMRTVELEEEYDEEARQFFEIIFSNLKDSGLSTSSERNLRHMLSLT